MKMKKSVKIIKRVGARATLLPGTYIGHNSIVGTGAVVKGVWPPESIIIGNPAQCVGKVSEWLGNKFDNIGQKKNI